MLLEDTAILGMIVAAKNLIHIQGVESGPYIPLFVKLLSDHSSISFPPLHNHPPTSHSIENEGVVK
jgi:hypothetical protein